MSGGFGEMLNCVISNNSAESEGGGIAGSHGSIRNCTIVNNKATNGAGLATCQGPIESCAIWGNDGSALSNCPVPSYSCYPGGTGTNIDADPCLMASGYWDPNGTAGDPCDDYWVGGDYHLRLDSPCIDVGDPNYDDANYPTDIDGFARVVDGDGDGFAVVDMGADEVGAVAAWHSATQCYGDADGDGDIDTVDWPAFRDAFGGDYPEEKYNPAGDFDRDGDVDTVDWPAFRDNFQEPVPWDCGYDGVWPPGG